MPTNVKPVVSPEDKGPVESWPERTRNAAPGDDREQQWYRAVHGPKPPPPPRKPLTHLEELELMRRKVSDASNYVPLNATYIARILAQLSALGYPTQHVEKLRALAPRFEAVQAQRRSHNFRREEDAEKKLAAEVVEAVRKGQPLPEGFSLETIRSKNKAVDIATRRVLAELQAEAYPLVLELGCQIINACAVLAVQAEAEERALAKSWGLEPKGPSAIEKAYRGVAAFLASMLPAAPSTLHSIYHTLPVLAADLKAK